MTIHAFGDDVTRCIEQAERATAFKTKLKLNIALGYGGRADILQATKLMAKI